MTKQIKSERQKYIYIQKKLQENRLNITKATRDNIPFNDFDTIKSYAKVYTLNSLMGEKRSYAKAILKIPDIVTLDFCAV